MVRLHGSFSTRSIPLLAATALSVLLALTATSAAQGLFDFLFGARRPSPPPSANAYVDPYPSFGANSDERRSAPPGGAVVFCVRLCDGRYFPMQRTGGSNPAQLCNAFCPASQTKVYSGGGIDHAMAGDGTRYTSLRTAFAFRERIVENCTCNGRDAHGLVPINVVDDPTLRTGDIVATNEGFVAYSSSGRRAAEFTPIQSVPGLPAELRERLAQTRIVPNNATPIPQPFVRDGATPTDRRVQLAR